MQQQKQQCSFSQARRNAVQAIPKHAIIILQVQIQQKKQWLPCSCFIVLVPKSQ